MYVSVLASLAKNKKQYFIDLYYDVSKLIDNGVKTNEKHFIIIKIFTTNINFLFS